MRFPPDFVEKVRAANNIVDIIAPYTQLRPSGSNFMGRCPFPDHNDKTASFSVSEDKQLYNCFGCKKSGNIFTFLQIFNGYSFPESIEYLAKRGNIGLPERDEDPKSKRERELKEAVLMANRLASSYFQDRFQKLPESHAVREYARKRGLTPELIEKFEIGFSPDEWHGLSGVLRSRKISADVGERAGLLKKSTRTVGAEPYDLFRGRLMFPILTTAGETVGFGGRVVGEGEPKYLNSPETPVFHKGRTLYGLNVTARHIRSLDEAIIVEGYMDTLALFGAGIPNVAAILGTAFTVDHGKLLKRMTPNVVMLLDGDSAGIQGAERSLGALLASDLRPRGVILPEGLDPDEYIAERGVEAFKEQIQGAGDLFTLLLTRHWMDGYRNTAQDKLRVIEQASNALSVGSAANGLAVLEKPIGELFIGEISRFLDVDPNWVRKTMTRFVSSAATSLGAVAKPESARGPTPNRENGAVPEATVASSGSYADSQTSPVLAASAEPAGIVPSQGRTQVAPSASAVGANASEPQLRIDLAGISREELSALALVLQSRALMQDLSEASRDWAASKSAREDHPIAMILEHEGARKLLGIALRRYGHQPTSFATLTASLMGNLLQPQLLSSAIAQESRNQAHGQSQSPAHGGDEAGGIVSGGKEGDKAEAQATIRGEEFEAQRAEADRKRMSLVIMAIQRKRKQDDLQRINMKLRGQLQPEESRALMEKFVELQREIRDLQRSEQAENVTGRV